MHDDDKIEAYYRMAGKFGGHYIRRIVSEYWR